ncbi:MAG TPA: metallophosphoesterase, partial [Acetobacteraceae bacterium]|nr:metallophosphoesterase [Acetobacteraceae bacterium]
MLEFLPAPAVLPSGTRVYAVGDVHGCLDRLVAIHAAIAEDLATRPVDHPLLIHLGDYVDRGPDSAGVVELLTAGSPLPGVPVVNLMGNHEDLMLSAIDTQTDAAAQLWLLNGGANSLHSWGVPHNVEPPEWGARLPARHLDVLRRLALTHSAGGYLFVHAGLRPGVPIAEQDRRDLLWMREPFLSSTADLGVV